MHSDLERRMAEFEEQLGCDPQSFSPLRRAKTAGLTRRRTREKRRILTSFSLFFPLAKAATENRQRLGALVFMATRHGPRSSRGGFFGP
jgi:hypothetical protein